MQTRGEVWMQALAGCFCAVFCFLFLIWPVGSTSKYTAKAHGLEPKFSSEASIRVTLPFQDRGACAPLWNVCGSRQRAGSNETHQLECCTPGTTCAAMEGDELHRFCVVPRPTSPGPKFPGGVGNNLYGLTYTPFALGNCQQCYASGTPAGDSICLNSDQVAQDLSLISSVTRRIRLYDLSTCPALTRQILQFARNYSMKVMVGVWINPQEGQDKETREFAALKDALHQFRGVISEITVGNEVILSQHATTSCLVDKINAVRQMVKSSGKEIPIGYVDVEAIYMENNTAVGMHDMSGIVAAVDFLGVNGHPYYENVDPLVSNAGDAVIAIHDRVVAKWNKSVIITECGFPSAGPAHLGRIVPTAVSRMQAVLIDVEAARRRRRARIYSFEAFDGDWKRRWLANSSLEDSIEYHWGIMTCDRAPKSSITMPPGQ